MARTNVTTVRIIINSALGDTDINSVIEQANRIVTRQLGDTDLVAAVLTDIETWLTAHIIAITKERQMQIEKVGDVVLEYNANPGQFLESTTYGQMALMLDSSGTLGRSMLRKARIRAIKQIND